MDDVLIVGAGPAGAVAATVLARAGARVRLLDRAVFPRDKLCGDTVNPGTLARLRRLGLSAPIDDRGLRVDGMRVTGPRGVAIDGRYPDGVYGRALTRRDLDWALLQQAIAAGARFEPATTGSPRDRRHRARLDVDRRRRRRRQRPRMPAARARDGCRRRAAIDAGVCARARPPSPAAPALGRRRLLRERRRPVVAGRNARQARALHRRGADPRRPRQRLSRQAVERRRRGVRRSGRAARGGVGPRSAAARSVRGRAARASAGGAGTAGRGGRRRAAVRPAAGGRRRRLHRSDDRRRPSIRGARRANWPPAPRSIRSPTAGTGSTIGWPGRGSSEFAAKWRFNRALRSLVASPRGVDVANIGARVVPFLVRRLIATAGDCGTV